MDFKQLRSFVAVVRYGSFTMAAKKLRVSQPTVSTHIRTLEEELGTQLVSRSAKRVELTSAGYKMFDQAVSMLSIHDRMIQSMRRRESDAIYLGASSIPSGYILPGILAEFGETYPDVHFVMSQDSSQAVVDGMLAGVYDLGFVGMAIDEDTIESQPFCDDKIVLVTANNERFRTLDLVDPAHAADLLRNERLIMRKSGSATRAVGAHILEQLGIDEAELNVVAHLDDQEAIKNLVEQGLGVSLMSEHAVRNRVASGWLCSFDIPGADCFRRFYVIRRKNVELGQHAEALYRFVQQRAQR